MSFDYRKSLIGVAANLLASGSHDEALFQLQRLVTNFPGNADNHQMLGDGYLQSGALEQARLAYNAALVIDPVHVPSRLGTAKYWWRCGDISRAQTILSDVQREAPENIECFLMIGQIEVAQGLIQERLSNLQRLAQEQPDDARVLKELGRTFYLSGRSEDAHAVFSKAGTLIPEDLIVLSMLSVLDWQLGQPRKALDHVRKALTIDAKYPEIVKNFIAMQSEIGGAEAGRHMLALFRAQHYDGTAATVISALQAESKADTLVPPPRAHILPHDSKLVVFVGDWPRTRHAKLAYGLRSAGWQTVLLCKDALGNDLSSYFDEVRYYKDDWEAVALAGTYSPQVYHVFSIWSDSTAVAMIKHKPGKVVYDCYDVVEGINGADSSIPDQKYCLENADALCCRDLRFQPLKRSLGYCLPKQLIFFPEYCWNSPIDSTLLSDKSNEEIHAVTCGAFDVEKFGQEDSAFLEISKCFARQGVHLHIYPSPMQLVSGPFEEIFSDYIELAQQTPFFHLHRPVPLEKMIPELRKYDVGLLVARALVYSNPLKRYSEWQIRYSGPARMYDYLDAGLPIMVNRAQFHNYTLFARYGIVLDTTPQVLANLKANIRALLSSKAAAAIHSARADYDIRNQIQRLIDFYKSL